MCQILLMLSAVMIFISSAESSRNDTVRYSSELHKRNLLERYLRDKRTMDDFDNFDLDKFDMFSRMGGSDLSTIENYDLTLMQETLAELQHLQNTPATLLPLGWKMAKRMLPTPNQMYTYGKDSFAFGMNIIKSMMGKSEAASSPEESKSPPVTFISVTFPVMSNAPLQPVSSAPQVQTYQISSLNPSTYQPNPTLASPSTITFSIPSSASFQQFPQNSMTPASFSTGYQQIPSNFETPAPVSFNLLASPAVSNSPNPETTHGPVSQNTNPSSFSTFATIGSNSAPSSSLKPLEPLEPLPPAPSISGTLPPLPDPVDPNASSPNLLTRSISFTSTPVLSHMTSPNSDTYSPVLSPPVQSSKVPTNPNQSNSTTLSPTSLNRDSSVPPIATHAQFPRALVSDTPLPTLPNSYPFISPVAPLKVPLDKDPPNVANYVLGLLNRAPTNTSTTVLVSELSAPPISTATEPAISLDPVSKISFATTEVVPSPPMIQDSASPVSSKPISLTPADSPPTTSETFTPTPPTIESDPSLPITPDSSSSDSQNSTLAAPIVSLLAVNTPDLDPLISTSTESSESVLSPTPQHSFERSTTPIIPFPTSSYPVTRFASDVDSSLSSPGSLNPYESDCETGPQLDSPLMSGEISNDPADDKMNTLLDYEPTEDYVPEPLTLEELMLSRKKQEESNIRRWRFNIPNGLA